jgi:hypothetical protein
MWTNIRRPLKVALRICLQTMHVNEHSTTYQRGSNNMFTNLACERTFFDPSKWLLEYVYKPCMWTNIRRPLNVALRICLQTFHVNEARFVDIFLEPLSGVDECSRARFKDIFLEPLSGVDECSFTCKVCKHILRATFSGRRMFVHMQGF